MQEQNSQLIQKVQDSFAHINTLHDLQAKKKAIECGFSLLKKLQTSISEIQQSYKQKRLKTQLDSAKTKMKSLYQKTEKESRMVSRLSRVSITIPNSEQQFVYDPKLTLQHNLIKSMIFTEIRESQLLLQDFEIEDLARKMEANKGIIEEIAKMIEEQGEGIDVITSNVLAANENVKKARNEILKANEMDGGQKVEFDGEGNILSIDGIQFKEGMETRLQLGNTGAMGRARLLMRSSLAEFRFKIKEVFKNLFGRKKQKQSSDVGS